MLGLERLTIGYPVYAFGAESLGQTMMYPDDQAPGSDPGRPLVTIDGWRDIPGYDPDSEVARVIRETLAATGQITGIDPVAHLPAPYSFAAEIFGQEHLLNALSSEPDTVRELLAHLADVVLVPWCADLVAKVPNVWLELSDASGSPMFIGPRNFLSFVVEPVRRLVGRHDWGDRVFVANYRGASPGGAGGGGGPGGRG
ncbi:MAG: uroporphyrinogen decarboxylase family protein, partial [Acidimicrobiales bacterium]